MPIPETWVYITTNYMGYLSAIRQHGPIVHPAKVKRSEAIALMMSGAPIVIHDPDTKMNYPLTMESINKTATEVTRTIPEPISETVLKGAPKGAGDFGIGTTKVAADKVPEAPSIASIIAEQQEAKTETVATCAEPETKDVTPNDTVNVEEIKTSVESMIDGIKNGTKTEGDVVWSEYTKAEKRQIRAAINAKAAENTEE